MNYFVYVLLILSFFQTPIVKLPDLKLNPNIFNMSPMSLVNCSPPQAPHPSQVPMPTELCPPFGDKFKPITTINNNNHYNNNKFCCPMINNGEANDQGNYEDMLMILILFVNTKYEFMFFFF